MGGAVTPCSAMTEVAKNKLKKVKIKLAILRDCAILFAVMRDKNMKEKNG